MTLGTQDSERPDGLATKPSRDGPADLESGGTLEKHTSEGSGSSSQDDLSGKDGQPTTPTAPAPGDDKEYITGLPLFVLMVGVILSTIMIALNGTVLGTAIPSITAEFNSVDDVGWYGSALLMTNACMAPLVGKLFQSFHIKITYISFIIIFMLGSVLGGLATSSDMLIASRAVAGIGGSGILGGSMTCIAAATPIARRASLNGILLAFFALAQAVGPLIGGALTPISWRWCFYINLPIGAITIAVIFLIRLPELASPKLKLPLSQKLSTIDFPGFAIFVVANLLLLLGLEWGGSDYAWSSPTVVGLLAGGVVAFGVLGAWFYHRGDAAMIPTRMFRGHVGKAIGFTAFVQNGGTFVSLYWLPIWFQAIKMASPLQSGVMFLPLILSQLISSVVCGFTVQKTGYYLPEIVLGNILIAVGSGMTSTFAPDTTTGQWIGYQILLGVGRGFVLQLLVTAMQANVPKEDAPLASGFVMFSQFFGGAIFSALAKTVFSSSLPGAVDKFAPGVSPELLIKSGATELSHVVPAAQVPGVILAYNEAIDKVFVAAACCAFVTGFGMGSKNLNRIKQT